MDKNTFAPRPPMGWNSYDYYDTTVNEEQVKKNADAMARCLKPYGYEYIVVDIQWYAQGAGSQRDMFQYIPFSHLYMDEYCRLQPDPQRFPSAKGGKGFGPLADYVHGLGLKFGIHIMRGIPRAAAQQHMKILGRTETAADIADPSSICGWNPDMYGVREGEAGQAYYDSLLQLYASWGVDFIKCDDICNTNLYPHRPYSARHEVEMLHKAIERCGREIVLSLSPGPALLQEAAHYEQYANMWRITDDFWDNWPLLKDMFSRCEAWAPFVKQGCYPDCDMLPIGKVGKGFGHLRSSNFTRAEQRTMMTLWCLFGSPLMIGGELTLMNEQDLSLLTNERVLSMLDPAIVPRQLQRTEDVALWLGEEAGEGRRYLAMFNLSDREQKVAASGLWPGRHRLLELWTGEQRALLEGRIQEVIEPHACRVYQVVE
ncbi:MAG: glycoside hydrolase family 27 protein [Clostridia bacterium]|nr:glycoside hydrolase family 27 protein [Clostridia bacterium]